MLASSHPPILIASPGRSAWIDPVPPHRTSSAEHRRGGRSVDGGPVDGTGGTGDGLQKDLDDWKKSGRRTEGNGDSLFPFFSTGPLCPIPYIGDRLLAPPPGEMSARRLERRPFPWSRLLTTSPALERRFVVSVGGDETTAASYEASEASDRDPKWVTRGGIR